MGIIQTIKTDIENVLDRHAGEIETAAGDVASLAASPVAVAIANAVHVPASVLGIIADTISRLDAEFAAYDEQHQAAAPAEPSAPAAAAAADPTPAEPSAGGGGGGVAGNGTGQA